MIAVEEEHAKRVGELENALAAQGGMFTISPPGNILIIVLIIIIIIIITIVYMCFFLFYVAFGKERAPCGAQHVT